LPVGALFAAEADGTADQLLPREDPVDAVEGSLRSPAVDLEAASQGRHQRALGRAVRAVEEDELVGPPRLHEVAEDPVNGVLGLLLAVDGAHPAVELQVEEAEAPHGTEGRLDLPRTEVIEGVPQ